MKYIGYRIFKRISINERCVKIAREIRATIWEYLGRYEKKKKHVYPTRYGGISWLLCEISQEYCYQGILTSLADFLIFPFFVARDMRTMQELATKVAFNSRFPKLRSAEIRDCAREVLPTFVRRRCGFAFDLLGIAVSRYGGFSLRFYRVGKSLGPWICIFFLHRGHLIGNPIRGIDNAIENNLQQCF